MATSKPFLLLHSAAISLIMNLLFVIFPLGVTFLSKGPFPSITKYQPGLMATEAAIGLAAIGSIVISLLSWMNGALATRQKFFTVISISILVLVLFFTFAA